MSYYSKIKRYLKPVGEQESDFYIKATQDALKKYFKELKRKFIVLPIFMLNGTVVVGNFSYAVTGVYGGKFMAPTVHDISYLNIKDALWTENPNNSFPNLFALIGRNIASTFTFVTGDPMVTGPKMPIILSTSHFRSFGLAFMSKIKTIGKGLTPDIFHMTLSEYIEKAINSITPQVIALSGAWIGGGMFSGTVTVNLANVKL